MNARRNALWGLFAGLVLLPLLGAQLSGPAVTLQRQRIFISDFGGIPNDGKDDGPAIARAITAARVGIAAGQYHQVTLHFTGGIWDIDRNNAFHPLIQEDGSLADSSVRPPFGLNFTGDAQNYTTLKLHRDSGNERWFYDSGSAATGVVPGWNRVEFEDLWFMSDQPNVLTDGQWNATYAADVNGFRIGGNSLGVDKGFIFRCCRFNGLGQPHTFAGTAQTDSLNASSCWYANCGPIVFENDQAILCNWEDCHFFYPTDCIWVKNTTGEGIQGKGGVGNTYLSRCDLINVAWGTAITSIADNGSGLIRVTAAGHGYSTNDYVVISGASSATGASNRWQVTKISDDVIDLQGSTYAANGSSGTLCDGTTPYYLLRVDDGAGWTRQIVFQGGQTELRQTYKSRLVHKRGNSAFTFSNQVLFEGCNLSVSHGAESGANGREYLTLGGYTVVTFNDCAINERMGVKFYDVNENSVISSQYQPLVEFNGCMLGPTFVNNLATRILYDSGDTNAQSYGRVISRHGRSLTATNLNDSYQFSFDFGPSKAGRGEPEKEKRWIPLKAAHRAWPTTSSGVGTAEHTVTLAPNAKIWAISIDRPASGSASTLTSYRLGPSDKSIYWAQAGPIRADARHKAYADAVTDPSVFPIEVGTDSNLRTVRLWQGPVEHALTTTGGEVMILVE